MATLTATAASTGAPVYTGGLAATPKIAYASYTVAAALALNDVIQMVRLPAGARVIGISLQTTDLDTGGSPAIVLDVGDPDDTDRLIDGATIGQAGGISTSVVASTGFGYQYSAETVISVLVQVAPATGATSGTIQLAVTYVLY